MKQAVSANDYFISETEGTLVARNSVVSCHVREIGDELRTSALTGKGK
jgi:hypothetical protein